MMHNGKCPKCEKVMGKLRLQQVDIDVAFGGKSWNGVSYQCPFCNTVVGAQIDPIAIKTDMINELTEILRGRF
jgi:hypothetical protein